MVHTLCHVPAQVKLLGARVSGLSRVQGVSEKTDILPVHLISKILCICIFTLQVGFPTALVLLDYYILMNLHRYAHFCSIYAPGEEKHTRLTEICLTHPQRSAPTVVDVVKLIPLLHSLSYHLSCSFTDNVALVLPN